MQGGKENGSVCLSVSSGKFQYLPWSLWPAVGATAQGMGHVPTKGQVEMQQKL